MSPASKQVRKLHRNTREAAKVAWLPYLAAYAMMTARLLADRAAALVPAMGDSGPLLLVGPLFPTGCGMQVSPGLTGGASQHPMTS